MGTRTNPLSLGEGLRTLQDKLGPHSERQDSGQTLTHFGGEIKKNSVPPAYQTDPENQERWRRLKAEMKTEQTPAAQIPPVNCPVCEGMGWVSRAVPINHPDFGKAFPCACALGQQVAQQRAARLFKAAGIDRPQYARYSMNDYEPGGTLGDEQRVAMADAIEAANYWVENGGWLVLFGPPGTGKTSLGSAAFRARMGRRGLPGLVIEYARMTIEIQNQYGERENKSGVMVDELISLPLLMLDDLGSEDIGRRSGTFAETDDRTRIIYLVIDGRYIDNRDLLLTTNLDQSAIATQFGERVAQRIYERAMFVNMGDVWLRGR